MSDQARFCNRSRRSPRRRFHSTAGLPRTPRSRS